ncbi:ubiquitin carboxyl-terminal hydrolase 2-like isoform X2 [Ostrea edulis]|nr:ubiquitin carboxyl-terminal hydrolase 2-like isoform X2 [Ostrea edulis]
MDQTLSINPMEIETAVAGKKNGCTVPKGLENSSQICYRNCILQIFAQTTGFFEQLKMKIETFNRNSNAGLTRYLYDLLHSIRNGEGSEQITKRNAEQFHEFLDKKIQRFLPFEQDDSHSFFLCVLGTIDEECNGSDTPSDLFKVPLQSSFQCSIQQDKIEYIEQLPIYSIPVPKMGDVQESLTVFVGVEHVINQKCECCDENIASHTIKRLRMTKVPKVVVLHIGKIGKFQRINTPEETRKVLKFTEDMDAFYPSDEDTNNMWHLYGVVVHTGAVSGGHYFSYVKPSGTEQWYKCNDMIVQQVLEDEVLHSDPYLLFYSN